MQQNRLLTSAQGFYVAGLVLGLLFIIPSPWFPLVLAKVTIVALCMLVSAVLFALGGGASLLIRERAPRFILLAAVLPIVYFISYAFSVDKTVGITGFAIEPDTILFILFGFLVFVLGLGLFRSVRSVRMLLVGVSVAGALAGLFQFLIILFGSSILPSVFADHSVNLVGKWNDLGILVGLLLLYALLYFEFVTSTMRRRILSLVAALVWLILLAIINFPLIWSLLIVFSIAAALWAGFTRRPHGASGYVKMIPWGPVVCVAVFAVLLLWGTIVNNGLTSILPVSSLEVRPSFSSTLEIIKDSHGTSPLRFMLGTGPNTFSQEWVMHKPTSVNQSLFWNLDFNVGYSSSITTLSSVGLLGTLALLIPFILSLLALVYTLRSSIAENEKNTALSLSLGSLYLWSAVLFYVPSEIIILLAYAFSGAMLGFVFSSRQGESAVEDRRASLRNPFVIGVSLVLILLLCWTTFALTRRTIAEARSNQGLIALQAGDLDQASRLSDTALGIEKTGDTFRLAVNTGLARLVQIGSTGAEVTDAQKQEFATLAQNTIATSKSAIEMNPSDYRTYVSAAKVYDYLASLGVAQAYESAKQTYDSAAKLHPSSPEIPLLIARLEANKGNLPGVQTALQRSLTLKPDYTDAILFVVQINIAQKDLPNAIKAATAAVQSAPGVPSIWFELGLLYYAAGDTKDAIPPLEEAIKRQSEYANAKYFLGLSYAAQNRGKDAIQQFQDLAKSNPDNAEVKLILGNLEAGKDPFAGAKPPVTDTPQERTAAPISQ